LERWKAAASACSPASSYASGSSFSFVDLGWK
jgi:hypothetical protein